eukprot:4902106-Pleurochrysis_carterae.AAC.1
MLCATGGSHTNRHQADTPKNFLFTIRKAGTMTMYQKKELQLKASTTKYCAQNVRKNAVLRRVGGVNVIPGSARSRRWGIVSTAVCTPR